MKILRMAAIALMALTLFASCKDKEPKKEVNSLTIRISDTQLRAIEDQIAAGTDGLIATDVVIDINDGAKVVALDAAAIAEAKSATGHSIDVKFVVTKVSMTANGVIENKEITDYQAMGADFMNKVPLVASTTTIQTQQNGDDVTYTATLDPKPELARLEVFGKITGKPNAAGQNAFKNIDVEAVYMNNYLLKAGNASRYMTPGNSNDGFDQATYALKAQMYDENIAASKADFEAGNKVAGYQLFPLTDTEKAMDINALPEEFFDHVILKVTVTYDLNVVKNRTTETEVGYVTMVRFMETATKDLKGFEAGYVYKLNLDELSKDFKTDDNGNPDTPVTPDPEPKGKKKLIVKVNPYKWEVKNIKPDVEGGGYKK